MGCPVVDLPKVPEVFFVAQKQSYEPVVSILLNFMFPAKQVVERVFVGEVENIDDTNDVFEEGRDELLVL